MTNDTSLIEFLSKSSINMGLELSAAQIESLVLYVEQLKRWNKTYNLTAIKSKQEMVVQHVLDSLAVIPVLNELSKASGNNKLSIMDVGSGAGLPGIIIAIATDYLVHCVDTVEKKSTFIRFVSGVLGIDNVTSHHARVETMQSLEVDVVISRAFSSLEDFVKLAGHHVTADGLMLAMKGKLPSKEIQALKETPYWRVGDIHSLVVPGLNAERCLIEIRPIGK